MLILQHRRHHCRGCEATQTPLQARQDACTKSARQIFYPFFYPLQPQRNVAQTIRLPVHLSAGLIAASPACRLRRGTGQRFHGQADGADETG